MASGFDAVFEHLMLGEVDFLDFLMLVGIGRRSRRHGWRELVEISILDLIRSLIF